MIFTNTKRLLTLWIGAFICAFSLHIVLGAQFYFQSTGVSKDTLSPIVILTVVQEAVYPDVDTDFSDLEKDLSNMNTEEELQSDLSQQESENFDAMDEVQPDELQHTEEKSDFALLKSLEKPYPQEVERKVIDKKPIPIPKAIVRQSTVKRARSSTIHQSGDAAAREDALLVEWLAKVQTQLEMQKKYVVGQRNSSAKGTVKLEFRVHEQGSIFSSRVVVSAGNPELDRLAMTALSRVGSFPPPPPSKVNKIIRVSLIFS
ncbi:energy transducer TonB family protein [Bartonella vinsonii]|uniref:energy transducer TonB family protein n=1 Tax=Bartonella vinsonii TaxID=33047 RepID=UPI0002B6E60D|nr:TonB family protein [Bartonella vinsonii]AGF75577.1 TonB protein [Bartonella vinsonii subsp. berkhoffii str. Winnie]